MLFQEKLMQVLPTIAGISVHVTGDFGEPRPNGKIHKGIDFNYLGGQTGINLTHPKIYSPIEGKVTFIGGNFGTIKIQDQQGYSHEFLHTHIQKVKIGEQIKIGDELGTMGGKGPLGYYQYPQHVHYQIKNLSGEVENPKIWWNQKESVTANLEIKNNAINIQEVITDSPFESKVELKSQETNFQNLVIANFDNILSGLKNTEGQEGFI